ncbi:VWA domain-containing protein [Nocardiopsis gilva]|nr:VWA domain-containing protein [Nocardiopsis gilva]
MEDIEVTETEHRTAAAVCLLVDLSYSMVRRGLWTSTKQTAMALHTLVTTRFPQDAVRIIGFNDHAREIPASDLAELTPDRVQGTNLQHALALAGRHLDRHPDFTPIVLIVTDGEPTAHLAGDGSPAFQWPPSAQTTAATLAEVDRMTRRDARLRIVLLADDPRLRTFADDVARRNGGDVVQPDSTMLGAQVVHDFLARRRGIRRGQ